MSKEEEDVELLSKTAAVTFLLARAFNLWNEQLEVRAKRLHQVHTQETRFALRQIADGCAKAKRGLDHFEEWAQQAGVTQEGHAGDAQAFDAYMTDGGYLAAVTGAIFNASLYDESVRVMIESLCKIKVTGKPAIPWEDIEKLKPIV